MNISKNCNKDPFIMEISTDTDIFFSTDAISHLIVISKGFISLYLANYFLYRTETRLIKSVDVLGLTSFIFDSVAPIWLLTDIPMNRYE